MRKFLLIIVCACAIAGCRESRVSDDPTLRLTFSCDTLSFDTVFTAQGSATARLMVYNRNANAIMVDRVILANKTAFRINVDGEPQTDRLNHIQINGGDSLFVFVRVEIDPTNDTNPLLVSDRLCFQLASGTTQEVLLEAYGQNVRRIGAKGRMFVDDYTFDSTLPYLIRDSFIVNGKLTIQAGATIYMRNNASLFAQGDVEALGTLEQPIVIRSERLDNLFDSVPYLYAGGSWNGVYLLAGDKARTYDLHYLDILSGNVGLYCASTCTGELPRLTMDGCRIHNHTLYGLVLLNADALVTNTEISNCASYCVYCSGGKHDFVHSTVASYFGYTSIRIQSVSKEDAAAVYIDNLGKTAPQTVTSFYNSIITGYRSNQLVVATPFDRYYPGIFKGNYLKTDTLAIPHAEANIYHQKDDTAAVFRNDFYKYKEYVYYDFRLDSLSPAIGIGDSLTALPYPLDRNGLSRALTRPDAGCYQHEE
ncbi:MAG: right-handed parallel beta-helix repeat-containing protein [Paludibacteraceae bacterium]|nr:right-handed parallel beta-helix repeat-containing protein [Paludibacteraceae bacterium]